MTDTFEPFASADGSARTTKRHRQNMDIQLKAKISKAIDNVINEAADEAPWDGYIHNELVTQMTNAAEQVFDAAMTAQAFQKRELGA